MFPIIPSHILRQPTPVSRSALTADRNMWTVWTDSVLNRNDFAQNFREVRTRTTGGAECVSESESEGERSPMVAGCFASGLISKDSRSYAVESFEMYAPGKELHDKHVGLRVNSSGHLIAEGNIPDHVWIKAIKLSNDTQSNNAILETTNQKQLRVRITKNVQIGEEILLWFSEEILALMYIPFLTPANIRGELIS